MSSAPLVGLLVAMLVVAPAFGSVRLGSSAGETLIGTNKADQITGGGGNDTLKGLAGNDTYYFEDGWGSDTLEEKASYKVGGKKVSGGRDTLSFRGVTTGWVDVYLVPAWGSGYNLALGQHGEQIVLGASLVENAVGGPSGTVGDRLVGGGEANTLSSGGGSGDTLQDFGGWNDGAGGQPELPASSDTFRGAAANTGTVILQDWGGSADVLDFRPLASDEVYLDAVNCDDDPQRECLQVVTGTGDGQVAVVGQFGEFDTSTTESGQHGRIEILRFADGDIRMDGDVRVSAASATGSATGKPLTKRQQAEAKQAPALLEAALRELDDLPEPGALPRR